MLRIDNRDKLVVTITELLGFGGGKVLLEVGTCGQRHFGSPAEGEFPALEAAIKQSQT
jgi:hypothetical protein